MSLFKRYLMELQVNGQDVNDDDMTMEDDTENTDEGPDDADDKAQEAVDTEEQQTETEETTPNADEEDNFTLDDNSDIDDTTTETQPDTTTEEDDNLTMEDEGTDTGDNADEGTADSEGEDDFTMDGDGTDENGEENTENGDTTSDTSSGTSKTAKDPTEELDDEEKKASEQLIYDSLTDNEKALRVYKLKEDYGNMYDSINNMINNINTIPRRNSSSAITIEKTILYLTKTKNILIDYIKYNFDNKSYIENYSLYLKYLNIFRTVTKVITELSDKNT